MPHHAISLQSIQGEWPWALSQYRQGWNDPSWSCNLKQCQIVKGHHSRYGWGPVVAKGACCVVVSPGC